MQPLIEPSELKGILTLSFCHWMTSLRMVGWEKRLFPHSLKQLRGDEMPVIRVRPCWEEKRNSYGIQKMFFLWAKLTYKLKAKTKTAHWELNFVQLMCNYSNKQEWISSFYRWSFWSFWSFCRCYYLFLNLVVINRCAVDSVIGMQVKKKIKQIIPIWTCLPPSHSKILQNTRICFSCYYL